MKIFGEYMPRQNDISESLRAWFLGPHAENGELFEKLIVETVRDHMEWRRNFHPEDGVTIGDLDRHRPGYESVVKNLSGELKGLLDELKLGVPLFSGRYKGHMVFEQTMAAQIGYFAAMLYNPNNVSVDASPVTTRLELEVVKQLARMVGYDPDKAWGHLAAGGTIANFEAVWIARSVQYLPVTISAAAHELGLNVDVEVPTGERVPLRTLGLWELLNLGNKAVLDLWSALWNSESHADVTVILDKHSLESLGYQEYTRRLASRYVSILEPSIMLAPATAHYSWEKILRIIGVGTNALVHVPIDHNYRLDPDALWKQLQGFAARRSPVLGCVAVCGTTEESAIDRMDAIVQVRKRAERELGMSFHLHADACYGGYAAATTWRADGTRRTAQEIRESTGIDWPSESWMQSMLALGEMDSVTIDPHKLGYIPYPAGGLLTKDARVRELISMEPPYLMPTATLDHADDLFLGRSNLEGSRPGAAAAAVWLSHKVLPLDERGYGYLIERTAIGARLLHEALADSRLRPFKAVMAPEPDINIVCFVMTHPQLNSLDEINRFNEGIFRRMSMEAPGKYPEYIITRTRFESPSYDGAVDPLIDALCVCTIDDWKSENGGLVVLRSTIMDPFLAASPPAPDHINGLIDALYRACEAALQEERLELGSRV